MRQSKMKYETVLKDETISSESTQFLGKSREQVQIRWLLMTQLDQRKLGGCLAANVHEEERKGWCCTPREI